MAINLITDELIQDSKLKAFKHYLLLIIKEIETQTDYTDTKDFIISEIDFYSDLKASRDN